MDWTKAKLELRKALAAVCHYSGLNALSERFAPQSWRILTYHRVTTPEHESFPLQPGMYVRPETFKLQMTYLKENANCISLDELTRGINCGTQFPSRTVVVTFDDGWLDNYRNALPVLSALKLPATIFLATDFIGTHEYFWTDRIAQILRALVSEGQYREQIRGRLWEKFEPPAEVRRAIEGVLASAEVSLTNVDNIIEQLKSRPPLERNQVVNNLWLLAKEFTGIKSERLFMNWDEVAEMTRHGISFGSHSHHHHPLTELGAAQLRDELLESYQALRTHGVTPSSAFCYPGGYYNDESQKALRAAEISFALTVERASRLDADPPLLGRAHIHQDVTASVALFDTRIFGPSIFN